MPLYPPNERLLNLLAILAVLTLLTACGGGSSSSDAPTDTSAPKSISGIVSIGVVQDADIEVLGTSGRLASGSTGTDGRFGPLTFDGTYNGPLRIRATGNTSSTWVCDARNGCPLDGAVVPWGGVAPFDGVLEAVVPSAASSQSVSVSLLSTIASRRADTLGALTAGNVRTANEWVTDTIRDLFDLTLRRLGLAIPDAYASVELYGLQDLPTVGGTSGAASLFLSLLNGGLMGSADGSVSTGSFIESLSRQAAALNELPVADSMPGAPSRFLFIDSLFTQIVRIDESGDPPIGKINGLLHPGSLALAIDGVSSDILRLPTLTVGQFISARVTEDDLLAPIVFEVLVNTNTSEFIDTDDITTSVDEASAAPAPVWLSATPASVVGATGVRVEFDNDVIRTLEDGIYAIDVIVQSTTGEFLGTRIDVSMTLDRSAN